MKNAATIPGALFLLALLLCNVEKASAQCDPIFIVCPGGFTVQADPGHCQAMVIYDAPFGPDNCTYTITQTGGLPSGADFPVGKTTNTFTITDGFGHSGACSFAITVLDQETPEAICRDITVQLDADGNYLVTPAEVDNGSHDNCGIATADLLEGSDAGIALNCSDVGSNPTTLEVTDLAGNQSTCLATITVEDNVPPQVNCTFVFTVNLYSGGSSTIAQGAVDAFADLFGQDACGIADGLLVPNTFTCADIPATPANFTVFDVNGNTTSCSIDVLVADPQEPTMLCRDITVQLDAGGSANIKAQDIDAGSFDNCGMADISVDVESFTCADLGANTVTLSGIDVNGNPSVANCTATVTVEDNIAPTVSCTDLSVHIGYNCNSIGIIPDDVATYSDACGVPSVSVLPNNFSSVGTYPVTVTATDPSGNSSSCGVTVTVQHRPATLQFLDESSGQYSDYPELYARLTDGITGNAIAGRTIYFSLNGGSAVAVTAANGMATTSDIRLDQPPTELGYNYSVDVSFDGDDCYLPASDSEPFEIRQEDATVTFTGALFSSTPSSNSGEGTLLLAATVCDISSSPAAGEDNDAGDVSRATVTFIDRKAGLPVSPPLPVSPLPGDNSKGTVIFIWPVDIGDADSETFDIGMIVKHHYFRNQRSDDVEITIFEPVCDRVSAGGYFDIQASEGLYPAEPGTHFNFGLTMKFLRDGIRLQGQLNALYNYDDGTGLLRNFQVSADEVWSLIIPPDPDLNYAEFYGNGKLVDLTGTTSLVSADVIYHVIATDNGEPGAGIDLFSLRVYEGHQLLFSTNWDGVQTQEEIIDGGNVQVFRCRSSLEPCVGPDSDGDGVCDAEDICEGGDDNQDADGDGTPDFCDNCNEFAVDFDPEALIHVGTGSSSATAFIGYGTDVSFTVHNVNAQINGSIYRRFVDVVDIEYIDTDGTTHDYGTFVADDVSLPVIEVFLPGPVQEITVTLSNLLDNGVMVGVDMTNVDFCGDPGFRLHPDGRAILQKRFTDNGRPPFPVDIRSAAFPNPFSESTLIEFTLPESGKTVLDIISLSGERVHRVHLGQLEGGLKQRHDFLPDGSLSGGTYLYRIISGQHVAAGKLIFIK